MSNVSSGSLSVSMDFVDSTTAPSITRSKSLSMAYSKTYTSGTVALVSGVANSGGTTMADGGTLNYKDAAGNAVSIPSNFKWVALKVDGDNVVQAVDQDIQACTLRSAGGFVATSLWGGGQSGINVYTPDGGTAAYTIIFYAE